MNDVTVELSTPRGGVFSGRASRVELRTTDGVVVVDPPDQTLLNLTHVTHVTLQIGKEFTIYVLENAVASLKEGRLIILAETIRRKE